MAEIIGNIQASDDYTHPLGPEPNFNESMYFNFFDPKQAIGGFVRLGNRANEGRAEMTVCLYLADGRVFFAFKRAEIDHNDAFDAGGLRFDVLEPSERLRTRYRGGVLELDDPKSLRDPAAAFKTSPRRKIALDLEHRACGPMYGNAHDAEETGRAAEKQFAKAHYEQHMRVAGEIDLADQTLRIDGFGLRDHSWGPRYWQAIDRYEWLTMNFGADLGAMVSIIQVSDRPPRRGGALIREGRLDPIVDAEIEAEYEENGLYHRGLVARIETKSGRHYRVDGRVRGFVPLRNRRNGLMTHIGEGMTEWTLVETRDGESVSEAVTGYGLSEFLRQV